MIELPGRKFTGKISRVSGALDTNTRTLLTEVQIPNPNGILLPGMYAQITLSVNRQHPPILIPGDAIVTRASGPQVAIVGEDSVVHFRPLKLGRDYGIDTEVLAGLEEGQQVALHPSDEIQEGVKVIAKTSAPAAAAPKGTR